MKDVEGIADRRRMRHVSRACVTCRRRKTKCNGAEPSCGTCLVHGLQCEYSSEPDRRKTKDSQELAALKQRVGELEERVRACEGRPPRPAQLARHAKDEGSNEASSTKSTPGMWGADDERLTPVTSTGDYEPQRNSPNALLLELHGEGDGTKGTN